MKLKILLFIIIIIGCLPAENIYAQQNDYNSAAGLLQQQRFEEALPILQGLYEENPEAHIFFDKYVETLINLKRLDKAKEVTENQVRNNPESPRAVLKLAEVLHLNGERDQALETWENVIDQHDENMQMYYSVASSMMNRREYEAAIGLYRQAQEVFNNNTLFLSELANTYMQAGEFGKAVNEFFSLVIHSPEQMGVVQQHFLQMRDENLYETASIELEDRLMDLDHNHAAYSQLYQLLAWLLLETEEYQRAFNIARHYENRTSHTVYSLLSLGSQFKSAGQYNLAAESFKYYLESSGSARFRAMEELATAYRDWAQHLQQNNLETPLRQNQLLEDSYSLYSDLLDKAPGYQRAELVYTAVIDLSLDHFKDSERAETWYRRLSNQESDDKSYMLYAEGRIAIFNRDFTAARQALTRADRATDDSNLSEKARYYLSLSDFYTGDYEFAGIQLRSLERRNTSFYANDAIKKRMWIKKGLRADSTGSLLETLGEGLHAAHTGRYEEALEIFEPVLANTSNPFADILTIEFSVLFPPSYSRMNLKLLERHLAEQPHSPHREKMLWNRAVLAEQLIDRDEISGENPSEGYEFLNQSEDIYTKDDLADLYEEVIIEFPNGFYATYSRDKLQSLQLTSYLP
ncbi:MAG: tetratricopeptide repeat protein [Balneolaceae bacterium]